jgi:hypothetical protein
MPFGLTYAAFVAGIGLSMVFGPVDTTAPQSSRALSLGTVTTLGDENFVTYTQISDQVVWNRFNPIYAVGLSDQGTGFISAGLGRRLEVFGIKIMPFTGPTLYFDKNNNDVIQFRTGFEISQNLTNTMSLTGGYYHISNGQANAASADIDVAHLGLRLRF